MLYVGIILLFGMGMVYVCWHVVCILNGSIENSWNRAVENVQIQKADGFCRSFVFRVRYSIACQCIWYS